MAVRNPDAGRLRDVVRVPADIDRDLRADMSGQAVMVLVKMRDQHAEQAVIARPEPRNRRQQAFVRVLVVRGVERQADIEREAFAPRLDPPDAPPWPRSLASGRSGTL